MLRNSTAPLITSAGYGQRPESPSEFGYICMMLTINGIAAAKPHNENDENDALTTALCITASAEELDRDLATQLREFTDVHAKAASNIQKVKDELAAAEKAEREAADERRAKKAKGKVVPPAAGADSKVESVKAAESKQPSLGLFDETEDEPDETSPANTHNTVEHQVTAEANGYPD